MSDDKIPDDMELEEGSFGFAQIGPETWACQGLMRGKKYLGIGPTRKDALMEMFREFAESMGGYEVKITNQALFSMGLIDSIEDGTTVDITLEDKKQWIQ